MRTGLVYRCKGIEVLPQLDSLIDEAEEDKVEGQSEEEEIETSDECYEAGTSEVESASDED